MLSPSLVTQAYNPSGGTKVLERWLRYSGSGHSWQCSGPPVPSKESGHVSWAKALGHMVLRQEGKAWGWFHRAAITSLSLQWKDNGTEPTWPIMSC